MTEVDAQLQVADGVSTRQLNVSDFQDAQLATRVDDAGGGVTYVGLADPGALPGAAAWRIKRLTESGGDVTVEWADGDAAYDNVWDSRASLTYS